MNKKNTGLRMVTSMAMYLTGNFSTRLGIHLAYMVRKGNFRQFPPGDFSYQDMLRSHERCVLKSGDSSPQSKLHISF